MITPLFKATARASDECGCTTPGRLARKDRAVHPLQYPAGSGVSLLRVRDKLPFTGISSARIRVWGRDTVGPGAGSPERRLLNPPCLACLVLVAPTNRELFAATLRVAAEGDTDASIDEATTSGASDLHSRLLSSPSFGGCRTCGTSQRADRSQP